MYNLFIYICKVKCKKYFHKHTTKQRQDDRQNKGKSI